MEKKFSEMFYAEKLNQYAESVKKAVDKLFDKAYAKQSDSSDLLLVILHGFYNHELNTTNYRGYNFNPFVFGLGEEGMMNLSQFEFWDTFRKNAMIYGSASKHQEYLKSKNTWHAEQSMNTQIELMVYLKFWESDYVLKQLYNVCRLIHGQPYDWYKKLGNSRKHLIEFDIKASSRNACPKFHNLIQESYIRQIRNAAAHSQYRISGDYLNLYNYDPCSGFLLKSITIEKWEEIFHKTMLLYNFIIDNLNKYEQQYREEVLDRHFGHRLRVVKKGGSTEYAWLRLFDPNDIGSRWVWYENYRKSQMKLFQIG